MRNTVNILDQNPNSIILKSKLPSCLHQELDHKSKAKSVLTIYAPKYVLSLHLHSSQLNPASRRVMLKAIFSKLKKHIHGINNANLFTHSPDFYNTIRDRNRNLVLYKTRSPKLNKTTNSFGYRLRLKRLAMGLNQSELAEKLSISRGQLSKLETERSLPSPITLYKLNELFGRI